MRKEIKIIFTWICIRIRCSWITCIFCVVVVVVVVDPNDQPNKFDYFDPELSKELLKSNKIASLSYTLLDTLEFFR